MALVTPTGVLDTSFDTDGVRHVTGSPLYAVVLDSAGDPVAGGNQSGGVFVTRLLAADGSPDTSFGAAGESWADLAGGFETIFAMGIDGSAGQIMAAGKAAFTDDDHIMLRYAP